MRKRNLKRYIDWTIRRLPKRSPSMKRMWTISWLTVSMRRTRIWSPWTGKSWRAWWPWGGKGRFPWMKRSPDWISIFRPGGRCVKSGCWPWNRNTAAARSFICWWKKWRNTVWRPDTITRSYRERPDSRSCIIIWASNLFTRRSDRKARGLCPWAFLWRISGNGWAPWSNHRKKGRKKGRTIFQMESSTLFLRCTTMEYVLLSFVSLSYHIWSVITVRANWISICLSDPVNQNLSDGDAGFPANLSVSGSRHNVYASGIQIIILFQQVSLSFCIPILRGDSSTSASLFLE